MKTISKAEYYKLSSKERNSFTGIIKYEDDAIIKYLKDGKLHRLDGPSYESKGGFKRWCIEGEYHRFDGPAVIWSNHYEEYWIYGRYYTKEQYYKHPEVIRNSKEFKDFYLWQKHDAIKHKEK